ncbi:MAG: HNH endonuclease [Deltaproteobacteria bacterium]
MGKSNQLAYRESKRNKSINYYKKHHLLDEDNPFNDLYYWSREVRIRDGHKCIICSKTRHLTSHHLLNKAKYPLLKYNINNGISLCFNCHAELHRLNDFVVNV